MLQWFCDLKLSVRILAMTVAILLAVVGVNYALVAVKYRAAAEQAMVEKAAAFTAVADAAKNHTSVMAAEGATQLSARSEQLLDLVGRFKIE